MNVEYLRNDETGTASEICPSVTANPKWCALKLNCDLHGEKRGLTARGTYGRPDKWVLNINTVQKSLWIQLSPEICHSYGVTIKDVE
jgi:hypothetical protein